MSTGTAARSMTADEFMSLPNDGMDRELIRGELREKPMSVRNQFHSRLTIVFGVHLELWSKAQPGSHGKVYGGEVGCRFADEAESVVGIDVAYWTAEQLAAQPKKDLNVLNGPPTLAIEILSPSNTVEEINEKLDLHLEQAVQLVWIVDPNRRTITVHQPHHPPYMVNIEGVLTGEDVLPGFRVAVKEIFK